MRCTYRVRGRAGCPSHTSGSTTSSELTNSITKTEFARALSRFRRSTAIAATNDPDGLQKLALAAARAGAVAIDDVVRTGALNPAFKSGSHDIVTAADRASERAIIDTIRAARPNDPILGEEGGSLPGTTNVQWLVDPLDGTANFIYGRADFAVSVGVRMNGVPVAGAILRPGHRQWVTGGPAGVTAGRDGQEPFEVRPLAERDSELSSALVAIGMPYDHQARRRVIGIAADLAVHVRGIRVMGCAAGDLAAITVGEIDAVLGFGLAEWDVAAGEAIVLAAGGTVRHQDSAIGVPAMISGPVGLVDAIAELARLTSRTSEGIPNAAVVRIA